MSRLVFLSVPRYVYKADFRASRLRFNREIDGSLCAMFRFSCIQNGRSKIFLIVRV